MNLKKCVDILKKKEDSKVALLIQNDPILQVLIIAWGKVALKTEEANYDKCPPLADLWKNVEYDRIHWANTAGLNITDELLSKKIKILTHNGLIYPDGSIHGLVESHLRTRASKLSQSGKK